jgi:two-component system sensor histidine kinase BaeS
MRGAWARVGLRGRLALAMSAVALLSVALATGLTDSGLTSRLEDSARARLQTAASHTAQLASTLYAQQRGRLSADTATELGHVAAVSGYRLALYDRSGRLLAGSSARSPAALARAQVTANGQPVGAVVLTPAEGQVLSAADRQLRAHLNTLHLIAALVALAAGLLAAVLLASQLARPLQALTVAARRIEHGELDARVQPGGAPETAQLGRAFNRLAATLAREEEIRRAAAADVAHELRTPLAGIVSRVEAAQDGVLRDEPGNLDAIHEEALRLTQLVDDLGKLADAEQPGLTLRKRRLDLAGLVSERVGVWRERFEAKGVALEQRIEPAQAYGDRGRLAQIVDNLLSNALRYTDAGGSVTVGLHRDAGEVMLEVADTGIGIADHELPNIFERFWRGEPSRARRTGGAGIGLAIVHELVRAHGGRIDVQSKPGEGSRFRVALPLASA